MHFSPRNILLPIALAPMLFASGLSGQTSQKITVGKASDYGLVYTLPITAIDIYLEAEITEEHPGEFYNYARRYLGDSKAIKEDSHSAILKRAVIVPRGVADPDNRWVAQFKSGTTPYMILDQQNIPLALNTEETAPTHEASLPQATEKKATILDSPAAKQAITAEMARSSSISKKAELASQRIFELRETRSDILSGDSENQPADGKAMQLVLDNLSAQESALTAMFLGTKNSWTVTEKYTIVPDSTDIRNQVLARLSAVDGLLEADNLAGSPVTVDIEILEKGEIPVNEKGELKTFPKGGVAYNIPGRALIKINYNGTTIASQEISLAQAGITFGMNPALFTDKKEPSKLIFDPSTGAILLLGPANQ